MILIGNGLMITRDKLKPLIQNGAVCVEGGRIKEVGSYEKLVKSYPEAELIDVKGKVIMPGLINAHEHIYSAFARGFAFPEKAPGEFVEILEKIWWSLDRKLTVEASYYSAMATFMECIKNGVTTVVDHHASYGEITGSLNAICKAAKETGIRTCVSYEISDRDGEDKMKQAVNENIETLKSLEKERENRIKGLIGLHASFTLSDKTLSYIKEKNVQKAGYHIHAAEGFYDEMHCEKEYGMSVIERLQKWDMLGKETILGHCVHIKDSDMDIIKNSGAAVVHNPESNMSNAVGIPKVLDMHKKGILVGLGTDGYTNDMLESLKVAGLIQKHVNHNPSEGSAIPEFLFQNNAVLADRLFDGTTGVLKEGANADIIVLDYKPATPMNENNYDGHILFGMSGRDTVTTMIDGKIIMKDRQLIGLNEEKIMSTVRYAAQKVWRSFNL